MNMINGRSVAEVVADMDCPRWTLRSPDGTTGTLTVVGRTVIAIMGDEVTERSFPDVQVALIAAAMVVRQSVNLGTQVLAVSTPERCFCGECPGGTG